MPVMFSIVIPLYNKASYIGLTLQSVLEQSLVDFEVLLIDDGSTDGGAAVVEAFGDSRVRVERQANAGVAMARNRGIELARGEWVAFLDADDCWHPHYLERQRAVIQAYPDVDVVTAQFRAVSDALIWSPQPWPEISDAERAILIRDLPERWMRGIPFFTSSTLVRTSRLAAMQPCFKPGESHGEDLDLWFQLAEISDIAWTAAPLVAYRIATTGSLTSLHAALQLPPYIERMQQRALSGSMPAGKRRSALKFVAEQKITMARTALVMGQRWTALKSVLASGGHRYSKRWYVTLLMAALAPGAWVSRWEAWRIARANRVPQPANRNKVS